MSEQKPGQTEIVETGIQLDIYGIKVKLKPGEVREDQPTSWREVGNRVNRHLMSLAGGLVGFLDDVVMAARSIIRGIARVPEAITKKIEKAHEESDRREDAEQRKLDSGALVPKTPGEARRSLENLLNRQKLRGNYVKVEDLGDGQWLIAVVRPEVGELTTDLAKRALLESGDTEGRKADPSES
jgi:hypothetical protein